jgi:hypothetical protein
VFVVEVRLEGAKRPKYAGQNDSVETGAKKAVLYDKDNAENCKRRLIALGFTPSSVFIRNKEDLKKKSNLFGAKPIFWHERSQRLVEEKPLGVYRWFGSTIEGRVYQLLRMHCSALEITCQYPLEVKPKTKKYPAIDWRVDFSVLVPAKATAGQRTTRHVEVKGIALPDFKRNVQYLQFFNPVAFSRLIIVGEETAKIDDNLTQLSFAHFKHLLEKGEL